MSESLLMFFEVCDHKECLYRCCCLIYMTPLMHELLLFLLFLLLGQYDTTNVCVIIRPASY